MKIFIYFIIIGLFLIIKKIFDVPFKVMLPMFMAIAVFSLSFNKAGLDTEVLDLEENSIPFGNLIMDIKEQTIRINEAGIAMDPVYTTITYKLSGDYERQFIKPTLDLLADEKIYLDFEIEKGFVGDYKIYLPKINDEEVFYISDFQTSNKKIIDLDCETNTPTCEITVKNKLKGELEEIESFSIILGILKDKITYNEKSNQGINYLYADDFKIKFNNGKKEEEFLSLIINDDRVDKANFFSKIVTTHSMIGLKDFSGYLETYDGKRSSYVNVEEFKYDDEDTFQGGLKPIKNTFTPYYDQIDGKKAVYTMLDTEKAYCFKTDIGDNLLFDEVESPYMYFIVLKSGGIVKQKSKNVNLANNCYSFILKTASIVQISIGDNSAQGKIEFGLYKKNFDGTTGEQISSYYLSNEGFITKEKEDDSTIDENIDFSTEDQKVLKAKKMKMIKPNFIKDVEGNQFIRDNIISIPYEEKNNDCDYILMEKNSNSPLIIELLNTNLNGVYTSFYVKNNGQRIEHEVTTHKIFYNSLEDEDNFINLYNLVIN